MLAVVVLLAHKATPDVPAFLESVTITRTVTTLKCVIDLTGNVNQLVLTNHVLLMQYVPLETIELFAHVLRTVVENHIAEAVVHLRSTVSVLLTLTVHHLWPALMHTV